MLRICASKLHVYNKYILYSRMNQPRQAGKEWVVCYWTDSWHTVAPPTWHQCHMSHHTSECLSALESMDHCSLHMDRGPRQPGLFQSQAMSQDQHCHRLMLAAQDSHLPCMVGQLQHSQPDNNIACYLCIRMYTYHGALWQQWQRKFPDWCL